MQNKKFSEFIKGKSNSELLDILKKMSIKSGSTEPEILNELIEEIKLLQLTNDEQLEFDEMLLLLCKTGETASMMSSNEKNIESDKYLNDLINRQYVSIGRLKNLLNSIGVLLIVSNFIIFVLSLKDEWGFKGLYAMLTGVAFAFIFFALSAIIGLLLDIEQKQRGG